MFDVIRTQAVQWCSDGMLEAIADASSRTGRRIHMHFLETRNQRVWADARFRAVLCSIWTPSACFRDA